MVFNGCQERWQQNRAINPDERSSDCPFIPVPYTHTCFSLIYIPVKSDLWIPLLDIKLTKKEAWPPAITQIMHLILHKTLG